LNKIKRIIHKESEDDFFMKRIIILILSIVLLLYFFNKEKENEGIIPDNAIRFRVIANSNTAYDQNIKIQIRNLIQNKILELTKDTKEIDEVRNILIEHKEELYELTYNKLRELNYDKSFTLSYGNNYFPKKKYKGLTYKDGNYESLVITLGEGKGDNFWCVLFPPLCTLEVDESSSDVEYKFFVKEIIDKYFRK
jgi:stage II sporulation protein R